MRRKEQVQTQSGGYTLIELLVVIAIIALLAGLLLTVIVQVRGKVPQVQTKNEMGQIGLAIGQFNTTYGTSYIPSALYLTNDYSLSPTSPALNDSRQYISKVWAKALVNGMTQMPSAYNGPLDGNQVLVLLLGGLPPRQGWFDSQTNPFQVPPDGSKAKGPFFEFKTDRINANGHYLDFSGNPYFYFSSRNGNDYDYFGKLYYDIAPDGSTNPDPYRVFGITREGGYGAGQLSVQPLRSAFDKKYLNPNSYQLISAGKNGIAGRGSPCSSPAAWGPAAAPWPSKICQSYIYFEEGVDDYGPGAAGGDDIGNFGVGATLGGGR